MGNDLLQGGVGLAGIGFAIKILWPLLSSRLGADSARSETDIKIHTLYQDALERIDKLSERMAILTEELGKARVEIANLKKDLDDAQRALPRYQGMHDGN